MKEDSIKEDIKIVENYLANSAMNEIDSNFFKNSGWETVDLEIPKSMQHILSDYKRVLKENEELKNKLDNSRKANEFLNKKNDEIRREKSLMYSKAVNDIIKGWNLGDDFVPVQKIEDIIDRIDYDIKNTKEIISNGRKNDYQIVRLRAMNTKSLDIKKRLQELLEGRK